MIKPWGSRAKSSFDCDRMTAMLAEINELRAVLGDLPESQAEMLQEIKKLRTELAKLELQEPVAWYEYNADLDAWFISYGHNPRAKTRPLVFGDVPGAQSAKPLASSMETQKGVAV
jgi:hypothetical protein